MYELVVYNEGDKIISRKYEDRPTQADKQDAVADAGGDFNNMGDYVCYVRKTKE